MTKIGMVKGYVPQYRCGRYVIFCQISEADARATFSLTDMTQYLVSYCVSITVLKYCTFV
jgi:hypothetical protein